MLEPKKFRHFLFMTQIILLPNTNSYHNPVEISDLPTFLNLEAFFLCQLG